MSLNTTPRTWVASEIVTSTEMNTEIRDAITGIQAAWTSFTPTLGASTTNPTLGTSSSQAGGWTRTGKTVEGRAEIVFGTSGAAAGSGTYTVLLPTAAAGADVASGAFVGSGGFFDSSGARFYLFALVLFSSTTARLVEASAGTFITNASPVIPTVNDQFRYLFNYQSA